jgi:hypothetical protein
MFVKLIHIPDLKQYLWSHAKETINDSESKDHGHAVDESKIIRRIDAQSGDDKKKNPTSSGTTAVMRQTAGRQLLESVHE